MITLRKWYLFYNPFFPVKIQKSFFDLIGNEKIKSIIEERKEVFVRLIESYKGIIPKNEVISWFGIEKKAYNVWFLKSKFKCTSSNVSLCAKRFPQQVTQNEYTIIEKSLHDTFYEYWPKSAIHADLVKKNIISISRSTYYKYAAIIKPCRYRRRRRKKYKALRAQRINEYWHFDISYYKIRNNQKVYIYALLDNYSRKILAWKCEKIISSVFVQDMLEEALGKKEYRDLILVSDGGPENTSRSIRKLLAQIRENTNSGIIHKIALKDISYSNSMIERFFRTMKYDYPYLLNNSTYTELKKNLEQLIFEYNYIRPHYAIAYLTPDEAYRGITQPDLKERFYKSQEHRNRINRNCTCTICTCIK